MTKRVVSGFLAGFVAVLVFHQTMFLFLHWIGLTPGLPWRMNPVPPFGVPAVLSASFWGGLWGILLAWLLPRFHDATTRWLFALFFGAFALTAVAWFIVAPLKGLPLGFGFTLPGIIIGLSVNGAWGIGTALLLQVSTAARPSAS